MYTFSFQLFINTTGEARYNQKKSNQIKSNQ